MPSRTLAPARWAAHALVALVLGLLSLASVAQDVTVTHTYDAAGRVRTATYSNGYAVTYSYDENGNRVSAVLTATPNPSVPGNLAVAAASSTRLNLSWTASTPGSGATLAGYKIERCQGASCTNFVQITTVGSTATTYGNTGLAAGTTYRYRVRAYDTLDRHSEYSSVASGTTNADTTPPSTPTGLAATPTSSTRIDLSWNASTDNSGGSGIAGYRLERCTGASCTNFSQIRQQSGRTYADTGRAANTTYRYRVRAYDRAGLNSGYSTIVAATTLADTAAPSAPTNLTVTLVPPSQINLSWTASTDSGGSGLTGYRIERCQGASCTSFAQIATRTTTSYSNTGLASSTTYSYRVRAYDNGGNNSGYSNTASATTPADSSPPTTPATLSATVVSSTRIDLSWAASTDSGGSGLTGYKIERCSGAGCTGFSEIGTATGTTYSSTGLSSSTTYVYRVRAYDGSGNHSGFSPAANATTTADNTAPSAPASITVTAASSTQLDVSWPPVSDAGGSGLVGYKLERCEGTGCASFAQITTTSGTSFSDTGRAASTTYIYRVRAYDGAGNHSTYSPAGSGTTGADGVAPSVPTNLAASAVSVSRINLSWTGSSDTGGSGLSGYVIERCAGTGCSGFAQIATTGSTSYSNTSLSDATTYVYRVRAYDAAGNQSSPSASAAAQTPDGTAPSTPGTPSFSNITASSASATWAGSSDNVGVAAYEYSLDGVSWPSNGTATTLSLTGLATATTYTVRVRARDAAGHVSGVASASFTTIDTVPPGAPGAPSLVSASYSTATLTWGAASDNVGVASYEYRLGTSGGFTSTGSSRSIDLSGLAAATTYTIQVRARDGASNAGPEATGTFDTSVPGITLPSGSFSVEGSGGATAYLYLTNGGDVQRNQSGVAALMDIGDWLAPKLAMQNFEVLATPQPGGTNCSGSATGQWVSLAFTRYWRVSVTGTRGAVRTCALRLDVRRVGTTTVLDSEIIAFTAVGI